MAGATTRNYPYPHGTDAPNVPKWLADLAAVINADMAAVEGLTKLKSVGAEDLDTVTTVGIYAQDYGPYANAERHYPATGRHLLTVRGSGNFLTQTAVAENDRRVWVRGRTSAGVWSTWVGAATTAELAQLRADMDARTAGAIPESATAAAAALYPVRFNSASRSVDLPVLDSPTVVDLATLDATARARYFQAAPTLNGYGMTNAYGSPFGWKAPHLFGFTTNAAEVNIIGYAGTLVTGVQVLVDGEPVEAAPFTFAAYNGYGGLNLKFRDARWRTVEVAHNFNITRLEAAGSATVAGYTRRAVRVGVLGDSWIDGTSQAVSSIGRRLLWDRRLSPLISALGGTGWVAPGPGTTPLPYTDPTRLGVLASLPLDAAVLWGSINDSGRTVAELTTAGQTMIDAIRATSPNAPILLTGLQRPSAAQVERAAVCQSLVAANTGVHFRPVVAALGDPTGPVDGSHPSPTGARATAEWLAEQILELASPVYPR